MSLLDSVLSHRQEFIWLWLGVTAAALAFRVRRPSERSSLRTAWTLLGLSLAAYAAASLSMDPSPLGRIAMGSAIVLEGFAVILVAAILFFRGLLPAAGFPAPRIVQDLAVTALSLGWLLLSLRLSGVDASQLFTTSALITAVVAFSMQDTLGNVLGGVALQLDNSLRVAIGCVLAISVAG